MHLLNKVIGRYYKLWSTLLTFEEQVPEGRACMAGLAITRPSWVSRAQVFQQPSICCHKASHRLTESPQEPYEIVPIISLIDGENEPHEAQ